MRLRRKSITRTSSRRSPAEIACAKCTRRLRTREFCRRPTTLSFARTTDDACVLCRLPTPDSRLQGFSGRWTADDGRPDFPTTNDQRRFSASAQHLHAGHPPPHHVRTAGSETYRIIIDGFVLSVTTCGHRRQIEPPSCRNQRQLSRIPHSGSSSTTGRRLAAIFVARLQCASSKC